MGRLLAVVTLSLLAVGLIGCGPSNKDWEAAEAAGRTFLTQLREQRFEDSHDMLDQLHPWGSPANRTKYVESHRTLADRYPGFFDWTWEFERVSGDNRTKIFKFKVILDFTNPGAVEVADDPDHAVRGFAREMLLNVVNRDGAWKIGHFRPFQALNPRFATQKGFPQPKPLVE